MDETISKIEMMLLTDSHILGIQPAEKRSFPEIDYSLFNCESRDNIKDTMGLIKDFLEGPCIIDDFKNHSDRREWKKALTEKYGEEASKYYQSNSLRRNKFNPLFGGLVDYFEWKYVGDNKPKLKRLGDKVITLRLSQKDYDLKSNDEKIAYVKEIKRAAYDYLEFFTVKPRVATPN